MTNGFARIVGSDRSNYGVSYADRWLPVCEDVPFSVIAKNARMEARSLNCASLPFVLAVVLWLALSAPVLIQGCAFAEAAGVARLQIRVAEVDRRGLRDAAAACGICNNSLPVFLSSTKLKPVSLRPELKRDSADLTIATPDAKLILGAPDLIRVLHAQGAWRELTEPDGLVLSGQWASFLAGGEAPIPVLQAAAPGQAELTALFKQFGVKLDFQAVILDENHLRLALETMISTPNFGEGVTIEGLAIPGLRVRRAKAVLELRDGQSFALAGLLDHDEAANLAKIPALNTAPILGELLKSHSFLQNETELVFWATVKLAEPEQMMRLPVMAETKPATRLTPVVSIEGNTGHAVSVKSQPGGESTSAPKPARKPRQNF